MSNYEKLQRGTDWQRIFKARPDLNPPGYDELLKQIREERSNETHSD